MPRPQYFTRVRVTDARLQFSPFQKSVWRAMLKQAEGKDLDIELREHKSRRSSAQNARYWALLTVGAVSLWGDPSMKDELHEEIAHLLLALPPCPKTGFRRRQRTPRLNTADFTVYMDRVVDKLIELGADLSDWDQETKRMEAA